MWNAALGGTRLQIQHVETKIGRDLVECMWMSWCLLCFSDHSLPMILSRKKLHSNPTKPDNRTSAFLTEVAKLSVPHLGKNIFEGTFQYFFGKKESVWIEFAIIMSHPWCQKNIMCLEPLDVTYGSCSPIWCCGAEISLFMSLCLEFEKPDVTFVWVVCQWPCRCLAGNNLWVPALNDIVAALFIVLFRLGIPHFP